MLVCHERKVGGGRWWWGVDLFVAVLSHFQLSVD
jgi:hypothetical protein